MVDEEVESILHEIRERVRAEQEELAPHSSSAVDVHAGGSFAASNGEPGPHVAEAFARLEAYLTTTARAWDRLPPLVSNRTGAMARLELWVKRKFKKATRWYAWEQINFNAAVHHALLDSLELLRNCEQQLRLIRSDTETTAREIANGQEQLREQQEQLEARAAELSQLRAELNSQAAELRKMSRELQVRMSELADELRTRSDHLLDEQRVCFKQLSVKTSEAGILLDRFRRDLESRLEKLETSKRKS